MKNYLRLISIGLFLLAIGLISVQLFRTVRQVYGVVGTLNINAPTGTIQTPGGIWNSAGNVGIGTTAPGAKLDVSGTLRFTSVDCINGYCPTNSAVRFTPNLHLNSNAGNAVIVNWDNGTTGATQTFRVGNGASADAFYVNANGYTYGAYFYSTALSAYALHGSGSSGYIPKFTGTYTAGNSLIYDNGANVGIGTTAPAQKLDVNGDIISRIASGVGAGTLQTQTGHNGNGAGYLDIYTDGVVRTHLSSWPGDNMYLMSNGGSVGIGTTAPGYNLEVAGSSYISGPASFADSDNGIRFPYTGGYKIQLARSGVGTGIGIGVNGGLVLYGDSGNTVLQWKAGNGYSGANVFSVDGSTGYFAGNVGIGTTAPGTKLDVSGGIWTSTAGSGRNAFYDLAGGTLSVGSSLYSYGYICTGNSLGGCNGTSGVVIGSANTSAAVNIVNSGASFFNQGNVGIGTTGPTEKLEVDGYLKILASTPSLYLQNSASGNKGWSLIGTGNDFAIRETGVANQLTITAGGNVGIGMTPASTVRLHVKSPDSTSGTYSIIGANASGTTMFYVSGAGSGYLYATAWTYGPSGRATKTNIKGLTGALGLIEQLRPSRFDYRDGHAINRVGFIAEEMKEVFPELVTYSNRDGYGIYTTDLIPWLVRAIQEQQTQIVSLKSIMTDFINNFKAGLIETKKLIVDGVDILKKLNALSNKVDTQQKQIEDLKKTIEELKK